MNEHNSGFPVEDLQPTDKPDSSIQQPISRIDNLFSEANARRRPKGRSETGTLSGLVNSSEDARRRYLAHQGISKAVINKLLGKE
jgi:hypothetical protein